MVGTTSKEKLFLWTERLNTSLHVSPILQSDLPSTNIANMSRNKLLTQFFSIKEPGRLCGGSPWLLTKYVKKTIKNLKKPKKKRNFTISEQSLFYLCLNGLRAIGICGKVLKVHPTEDYQAGAHDPKADW